MYKLLVIEDEELVRKGIVSLIDYDKLGIEAVYEAGDGNAALDIIREKQPDIVLSDINMPRMDGITLAKKIKSAYPKTGIIFLTGYDYFDYAVEALKLGADDYILKPISKNDVEQILTKTIKKREEKEKNEQINDLLLTVDSGISENESSRRGKIESIIADNLYDPNLSLKDIASKLGFSVSYLSTMIKKDLGINFQEYVIEQRIAKAKILLLTTDMKIYEIAENVGFYDVNYFSARFKHHVGMTPRQYQRGVTKE